MKYTLLKNFLPGESFDGMPGEDSRGKYILFSADVRDIITTADFLQTPSGDVIQIQEDDSTVVNGTRVLKLYYK